MPATPDPVERAVQIMDEWLNLPQYTYKATVYDFTWRLSAEELLEAVEIAQAKIPKGGMDAFKYFCGVCHSKIRENKLRSSWS